MPLETSSVDAVLASSSWHWMDTDRALQEAARVLVPGGTLGVVWAGPDPDGPFVVAGTSHALEVSSHQGGPAGDPRWNPIWVTRSWTWRTGLRRSCAIPAHSFFVQPEHTTLTWDVPLTADELIGLLGTFSWIITMPDDRRAQVIAGSTSAP